eukprot:g8338.t1
MPPLIGITTYGQNDERHFTLPREYVDSVRRAGGIPLLITPGETAFDLLLSKLDGVILAGGGDIGPACYAGDDHATVYHVDPERDLMELAFARAAVERRIPTFGICRGMQLLNSWMVPRQKYDVIHYVREAYLKKHNPTQFVRIDDSYLAGLPVGTSRGPKPSKVLPWERMDYGTSLTHSYEVGRDGKNFAYKGIAVRLDPGPGGVSRGRAWMVFDHDTLRVAAGWTGKGFIDWNGIMFNGRHAIHPRVVGDVEFSNPTGPGWANPATGSFDDPRLKGRDGRRYGPLPRAWAHFKGQYIHGDKTVLSYTVGKTSVLEMPGRLATENGVVFTRSLEIGPRDREMILNVATHRKGRQIAVGQVSDTNTNAALRIVQTRDHIRLKIAPGTRPLKFVVWIARGKNSAVDRKFVRSIESQLETADLTALTKGGPPRWSAQLTTTTIVGRTPGPFAIDVFPRPVNNPWFARVRFTGIDFYPGGNSAAICTWDGDVWKVDGLKHPDGKLTWRRIASGLFQPLGILIVDEKIHLGCRDQICILHDTNGDGETDYYENFNNDHQVTEHFHEFAMGLQRDSSGRFYYAKSARHAKTALVPHHGTLLRVSKDGSKTEILATGFRAANGVCLNPDGTFIVTDQEGHWNPKNRINWVTKGGFYGNMYGYHDVEDTSDSAMQQPLCWITNKFDRSPAELLWVKSSRWGPLNGSLLNLSYGFGKVYVVPHEKSPARLGLTTWLYTPKKDPPHVIHHLPLNEFTIAEALRDEGYVTGYFGKWHLGYQNQHWAGRQGFETAKGGIDSTHAWQLAWPDRKSPLPKNHKRFFSPYHMTHLDNGPEGEYLTDRLTSETIAFIEQSRRRHPDKPFFAFLSFHTVHTPLQPKPEKIKKYNKKIAALGLNNRKEKNRREKAFQNNAAYAGMVEHMDENVGRLLDRLDELKLSNDTIVVWTSDNGGKGSVTSNLPLRGMKHNLYEGGIRVPTIVRWPGRITPGSKNATPLISTDFYPTLLRLTGCSPKPRQHRDGVSFADVLLGKRDTLPRDALYWHYPHNRHEAAVRAGRYKLIHRFKQDRVELYDLQTDLGERNDISRRNPDLAARLLDKLKRWQKSVGARFEQ